MKAIRWMLVASLLANLALAALIWRAPVPPPPPSASAAIVPDSDAKASAPESTSRAARVTGDDSQEARWSDLVRDDLRATRDRLRAAGFPERYVGMILGARINERITAQQRALTQRSDAPFWEDAALPRTPETNARIDALSRERQLLLRELLAGYFHPDEFGGAYLRQMFGPFSPEKVTAVRTAIEEHDYRWKGIPQDPDKWRAYYHELHETLGRLLTPAELEQYHMRRGNASSNARHNLETFRATEDEYRRIFQPWKQFFDLRTSTPLTPEQIKAAHQEVQRQIAAGLSPERHADYQQAIASEHQTLNHLVTRFALPLSAARAVVAVQQDFTVRSAAIRTDRTLGPEQRAAQLNGLATEASAKVTAALGPRAAEAYRATAGQWLP